FAGKHRTDLHRLDACFLDRGRLLLVDQLTSFDEQRTTTRLIQLVRILDVLGREVTDDSLRERLDHVLAFLQRGDFETLDRTAILFCGFAMRPRIPASWRI